MSAQAHTHIAYKHSAAASSYIIMPRNAPIAELIRIQIAKSCLPSLFCFASYLECLLHITFCFGISLLSLHINTLPLPHLAFIAWYINGKKNKCPVHRFLLLHIEIMNHANLTRWLMAQLITHLSRCPRHSGISSLTANWFKQRQRWGKYNKQKQNKHFCRGECSSSSIVSSINNCN